MASSSSKERKRLYNKKRYASMDYTSKERQKEMMREYNNKRIYGFTSSMALDELYTCNNTSIENESAHIEGGNASINEIHQRKKNTVLDIERETQIAKEHSHENILEDEIEDLDESDDVIIFPSEESWPEIDGLFEDGETSLNATMTLASARNESESNDPFDFVYHGLPPSPNILQKQRDCKFCKAKRFQYEFPTFCCMNGKISLAPNEVPDELYRLFTTEEPDGVSFRHFIRCYNSHFSFTSLGATVDKNLANMRDGVYTFRAHGQIYHFLDQLVSQNEPKYLQLYFYDTDIELDQRMDRTPNLDRSTVQILMGVLSNNPYAQTFKMLRDIPTLDNYRITLNASVRELDQRTHNKPTASQVGAVWVEGNGDQTSYKRSIIVYNKNNCPTRVQCYHGCYDPLGYPLLHPNGEPGWHKEIPMTIMAPIWKLSSRVKAIENIRALVGLDVNVPGGLDLNIEESIGADGVDSLYLAPQPLNVAVNGPVDAIESIDVDGVLKVDSPDPAPQLLNVAVNGPINVSVNAPGQKSTRKMKELSYALVAPLFKKTKKEAAKELRVSQSTLAVWCRRNNIPRWPYRLVSSMENMLSNIQECGMDGFLKEKGSSFTMSEIADKKRSFEANPSEPIEDSVLLLRTRMHRAVHYKRRKVVKKVVKDNS